MDSKYTALMTHTQSSYKALRAAFIDDKRMRLHSLKTWHQDMLNRLHQARQIIGSIQIKVDAPRAPEKVTRAFVNVRMPDRHPVYTAVSAALADPAMRGVILERALSELEAWRRRYETLSELALVFEAIEKVRAA